MTSILISVRATLLLAALTCADLVLNGCDHSKPSIAVGESMFFEPGIRVGKVAAGLTADGVERMPGPPDRQTEPGSNHAKAGFSRLVIKCVFLAALVYLLVANDDPVLCAGLYAGVPFILGLIFGLSAFLLLIGAVISFVLAIIYFGLLKWVQKWLPTGSVGWWLVAIAGMVILLL